MPHFGGRELAAKRGNDKVSMWQNNFDHSAVAIAAAIKRAVGDTKVLLVIHDWGAMWGFMCQNLFPQQVKAIIALDVGPPMFNHRKAYHIIPVVIVGIIYQVTPRAPSHPIPSPRGL
jgi:pimeloyl-ACP methyl ester carboxylesterase